MTFLKELLGFLKSREFFSGIIERLLLLVICVVVYLVLIVGFLYEPAYLFYLIIIGMLFMAGLMLYLIFPGFREKMNSLNDRIKHQIKKYLNKQ